MVMMINFISPQCESFLKANKLISFDDLWNRNEDWFEPPNVTRSGAGWSGVVRIDINGKSFFLKRQENYLALSYKYPFRLSVAENEYSNITTFDQYEIPSLEVVACLTRLKDGKRQSLIMTTALDGYIDLDTLSKALLSARMTINAKRVVLKSLAKLIRLAHDNGLFHGNLYPNHLFVAQDLVNGSSVKVATPCRFIDMERAGKAFPRKRKQLRDIETLDRRTANWSKSDRLYFLLNYLNLEACDQSVRDYLLRLSKISKKTISEV
jgi:hypothetical protein